MSAVQDENDGPQLTLADCYFTYRPGTGKAYALEYDEKHLDSTDRHSITGDETWRMALTRLEKNFKAVNELYEDANQEENRVRSYVPGIEKAIDDFEMGELRSEESPGGTTGTVQTELSGRKSSEHATLRAKLNDRDECIDHVLNDLRAKHGRTWSETYDAYLKECDTVNAKCRWENASSMKSDCNRWRSS